MSKRNPDNSQDVIDIRDIIARVEELESDAESEDLSEDNAAELKLLSGLLEELAGYGGDEKWRGEWYPFSLIRDSYFEDYARETAEELGVKETSWPYTCIDWSRAAEELQLDYSFVEYDGETYWYR